MKNNQFTAHHIRKKCEEKANIEFQGKKELNGRIRYKDALIRATIPKGRNSLPKGTYKSIANQLHLDTSQFDQFLDCSLKRDDYFGILDEIV